MRPLRRSRALPLLALLLGLTLFIWLFILLRTPGKLTLSFLNVGQGDAILIESPTGTNVLIDGGRDRSVLRELGKRLGPLDRHINLVVATHPDADHIGGLADVFAQYRIDAVMDPSIESETTPYAAYMDARNNEHQLAYIPARRGTRIELGEGATLDVLFPDRAVSTIEANTGSVILLLRYGTTSFLLTGDSPLSIEEWLVALDGAQLQSEVLKAGHHGSRTSSGEVFLNTVAPQTVVISAGKDNSYGHPHPEVVERIQAHGAILASTADGTVIFTSDGETVRRQK